MEKQHNIMLRGRSSIRNLLHRTARSRAARYARRLPRMARRGEGGGGGGRRGRRMCRLLQRRAVETHSNYVEVGLPAGPGDPLLQRRRCRRTLGRRGGRPRRYQGRLDDLPLQCAVHGGGAGPHFFCVRVRAFFFFATNAQQEQLQ